MFYAEKKRNRRKYKEKKKWNVREDKEGQLKIIDMSGCSLRCTRMKNYCKL